MSFFEICLKSNFAIKRFRRSCVIFKDLKYNDLSCFERRLTNYGNGDAMAKEKCELVK